MNEKGIHFAILARKKVISSGVWESEAGKLCSCAVDALNSDRCILGFFYWVLVISGWNSTVFVDELSQPVYFCGMWVKSFALDAADDGPLRIFRDRLASTDSNGLASDAGSFFFGRAGAPLNLLNLYFGAAFLIGGGPSFTGVDKTRLRSVWTMTLNNAVVSFRSNANCTVDVPSRFSYSLWLDPTIQKFAPLASLDKPLWDNRLLRVDGTVGQQWRKADLRVADCPNVIGFRRNEKFNAAQFLREDSINWGCHARYGGGRSVMLPALRILFLLGFRRVYLLGVDFEMSDSKKYHFPEDRPRGAISGNTRTYLRLQKWFADLQPLFLAENFIVKNCNQRSRLTAFPFMPFDEALDEATAHLGDCSRERTLGMYRPIEHKIREVAAVEKLAANGQSSCPVPLRENPEPPANCVKCTAANVRELPK